MAATSACDCAWNSTTTNVKFFLVETTIIVLFGLDFAAEIEAKCLNQPLNNMLWFHVDWVFTLLFVELEYFVDSLFSVHFYTVMNR